MAMSPEARQAWLDQVSEDIIDPERPIVDPHHHLWSDTRGMLPPYLLEDLWRDTQSGHNIVQTVFMECGASYLPDGPEHLRPTGETEFVAARARQSRGQGKAEIAGIVGHVDLMLDESLIREALSAHEAAGAGLFRGIRHGGAHDADRVLRWGDATPLPDLYGQAEFRRGVTLLGSLGYTYDTWHYHFQNQAFIDLARAVPDTLLVLDHFGSPVGVGPWADRRDEVFEGWCRDMVELASCDNVVVKIGGLAMPPNGFGWHSATTPATSDDLVAAQRTYYLHAIECFGPHRCMFESNFPVDKMSLSYHVYWNAMKKITDGFSEGDKDLLFQGTARRVYRV